MSRNNVIVVAASRNNLKKELRYYVFFDLCMDTEFTEDYIRKMVTLTNKSTKDRGKALIIAHDVQKKIETEYGVREIDI